MRFPERGMSPDEIGAALEAMRGDDADWRAGRNMEPRVLRRR